MGTFALCAALLATQEFAATTGSSRIWPFTVSPDQVGSGIQVSVRNARAKYAVYIVDPAGRTRRSESVSPAWGLLFGADADMAGTWTVEAYGESGAPIECSVRITVGSSGGGGDDDSDAGCGLLGLELLLLLILRLRRRPCRL